MAHSEKTLRKAKKSAERALDEGRNAARLGLEYGRERIEETGERITESGEKLKREVADQLGELKDEAVKRSTNVVDAVETRYDRTRRSLSEVVADVGSYTRDHMVAAVAVAGSLGVCLGFVLGRRSAGS